MAADQNLGAREAGRRPTAPKTAFWNDRDFRAVASQILVIGIVLLVGWYLVSNTMTNLAQRNIATGFGFIGQEAGFAISEGLLSYSAAESYGRAMVVGLVNTLLVAGIGIVLCTIIGVLVGVARLSSNWLIRKLAGLYVETVRNVPVLLQLYLWYDLIKNALPQPRQAFQPIPSVFLSNRGLFLPVLQKNPIWDWVLLAFAVSLLVAFLWNRYAKRHQAETGKNLPILWPVIALLIGVPALVLVLFGSNVALDLPTLQGFNFNGGISVSPELTALTFGLTIYTAAFVAENVRAGIEAVPKGQWEASRALGLPGGRILRMVILPQAMRVTVPPLTSQYLNLTKNSSLAVAIGYPDLVSITNTIINQTGQAIEGIVIQMVAYLTISLAISAFMNFYNKRIALTER